MTFLNDASSTQPAYSVETISLRWGRSRWLWGLGLLWVSGSIMWGNMRWGQSGSIQRSCYLKNTAPYEFPLPRPTLSLRKPVKPDWVRRLKRPFMRGVSLGMYFKTQDFDYDQFLKDISDAGASHVGFVISWYQKDVRSGTIERDPQKTVSDARLIQTIHQARARGLQVFLLPIIRLRERGPDDWRGVIKPTVLEDWWRSYRNYILHYARLSRSYGVELFSVGSELVSMEKHRQRWLSLISSVRQIFPGMLVYSANWDHYEPVTFWDSLDYIGISNYYELSKKKLPQVAELRRSWTKIRKKIEAWKRNYPRQPLIFTEVGYYSQLGTNIYPWDYTRNEQISLEEQRRCYRAFTDVWSKSKALSGTFFWNWFSRGGPKDKGYSPRGKPAECVLREWYAKIRRNEHRPRYRWIRTTRSGTSPRPSQAVGSSQKNCARSSRRGRAPLSQTNKKR